MKIALRKLRARDYQIVETAIDFRNMFAESLFEPTLCLVAYDALSHFFAYGKPDAHTPVGRGEIEYDAAFAYAGAFTV